MLTPAQMKAAIKVDSSPVNVHVGVSVDARGADREGVKSLPTSLSKTLQEVLPPILIDLRSKKKI